MTKNHIKAALRRLMGIAKPTNKDVAELFGIKEQAVQAWNGGVPALRVYELNDKHPRIAAAVQQIINERKRA